MRVRGLAGRDLPAIAEARARDAQMHARRTNSLGPSAVLVRGRARMSEQETSVVVTVRMSNKLGNVGRGNKESERRAGVRAAGYKK
jgi:hypothetical protein